MKFNSMILNEIRMKIALMNEFSRASKNAIIFNELVAATAHQGHTIFNVGMCDDNDHRLTYVHLGIISAILLNSRSVDFVITGCGMGQGALMALNTFPGSYLWLLHRTNRCLPVYR